MCRHLAYLGTPTTLASVLLEPEHSLYRQSWAPRLQRHGTVNADGYGIGWYPDDPDDPGAGNAASTGEGTCFRHRRAVPIWADANLPDLARAVSSHAFLAAVRSATAGTTQDESAAAPFREGRWLFSHNGAVPDWTRLPTAGTGLDSADLLSLEARCDSALLWAMVARRLRQGEPPGLALAGVVRRVAEARPGARLNLLLTDGRTIAATGWGDTLWYRQAHDHVLVASEPHDGPGWEEVPDRTLLLASPDTVRSCPLRPAQRHVAQRHPHSKDEPVNDRFSIEPRLPSDYLAATLRADVRQGLSAQPKTLPPKWFYDELGSKLFEQITELPEYYPTRACSLVELGSGSSRKTRLLLDALTAQGTLQRYSPLDVSASALEEAAQALCRDYPALRITAAVTDFEHDLALHDEPGPRLFAFLGSTIGNLNPAERREFYRMLRAGLGTGDALLLGVDLVKDPAVLVSAYDDSQGVTAAFNKNVLQVLNRELDADFDPDAFEHRAVWNADAEQIEMHLVARAEQRVTIPAVDLSVAFAAGESLRTEISSKFRRESLTAELAAAGFAVHHWWTDHGARFAQLLAVPSK